MCGIVGVAGEIGKLENQIFQDLLQIDVIRGPHSTGIAAVHKRGGAQIFKRALLPTDLLSMKGCKDVFNDHGQNIALIGHNRWATMGKVNTVNAHPFEFDSLVGCHNGTLRSKHRLPDHLNFDTDSENLFHSFEKEGVNKTIKGVEGAFALVWSTFKDKTIHFLRNSDRSLWYTFSQSNKQMFWASERWMLEGILARHNVEHQGILMFKTHQHYTLKIPDDHVVKNLDEFYMSEVEVYTPPKYNQSYHQGGGQQQNFNRTHNTHSNQRSMSGTGNFSKNSVDTAKGTNTDKGVPETKKRDNAGKSASSDGKNNSHREQGTKRTYQKGEIAIFRVPRQTPAQGQRYVYAVDSDYPLNMAEDTNRFRIYLPAGSAVRADMLANPDSWWEGVINGTKRKGDYVIQGNSVESAEVSEEELAVALADQEAKKEEQSEWDEHVRFIKMAGTCAWCSQTLEPEKKNYIANSLTVICPDCRGLDEVQQFIQ